MTTPYQSEGDRSRDQLLAGEYVLGILSPDAQRRIEERMKQDRAFAAMVRRWEENLAEESELDRRVSRLKLQAHFPVFAGRRNFTRELVAAGRWWNSLNFWRALSLALISGIITYAALSSGWISL